MISICMPIHLNGNPVNRPYAIAARHYASLGYPFHICGSEGEISKQFASEFLSDNVKYVEVPQGKRCTSSSGDDVLRQKFNDSLKTLPPSDWYCLVGADDLASKDYFEQLKKLDAFGMAGVGMENKLYLVSEDMKSFYSIKLNYKIPLKLLAGINSFSHKAMLKCGFRPYQLKGCETGAETFFSPFVHPLKGSITMFKGKDNLNTLEKILSRHTVLEISQDEIKYIKSLYE